MYAQRLSLRAPGRAARSLATTHLPQRPFPSQKRSVAPCASRQGVPVIDTSLPDGEEMGPSLRATLRMLEWDAVCEQIAGFASTAAGRRQCQMLAVPTSLAVSQRLLRDTRAVMAMELEYASMLDFGGINSSAAAEALARADKGALCSGPQLRGVLSLLQGADKLKRQVATVARQHGLGGAGSAIAPLVAATSGLTAQPALGRAIAGAIDEEGSVLDAASEALRLARNRCKALQSRATALLKAMPGEVSEKGGRMCVAVPAGTKIAGGITLGSSPGGGYVYVEPPSLVPVNNDLAAARGEAFAAEEVVLWDLTSGLMDALPEVEALFDLVVWMDVTAAKVRYGSWMRGVLPEFVPWDEFFHARDDARKGKRGGSQAAAGSTGGGAAAATGAAAAGQAPAVHWTELLGSADTSNDSSASSASSSSSSNGSGGGSSWGQGGSDPDDQYTLRLRELCHPLLQGIYLKQRDELERAAKLKPRGSGSSAKQSRADGDRLRQLGLEGSSSSDDEALGFLSAAEALEQLQPPRPVDILVRPLTSVVVITGPNTGGKTAAMKALGLAVCLAKCGVPVPAAAPARLPCFTSVLADIGDEQSLTASLSTFSGHLKRIQALRAEADGKALLLLDELGTGTDPSEGAALGLALLKRLVRGGWGAGALTVATTHHSVMTGLKFEDPRFENASVEFDEEALAPTYRLMWGIPGRSNALNIAARLGLDPDIVEAARAKLDRSVASANSTITELEALQAATEGEAAAAWGVEQDLQGLRARIAGLKARLAALQEQLADTRGKALLKEYVEARAALKAAKERRKAEGGRSPSVFTNLRPAPLYQTPGGKPPAGSPADGAPAAGSGAAAHSDELFISAADGTTSADADTVEAAADAHAPPNSSSSQGLPGPELLAMRRSSSSGLGSSRDSGVDDWLATLDSSSDEDDGLWSGLEQRASRMALLEEEQQLAAELKATLYELQAAEQAQQEKTAPAAAPPSTGAASKRTGSAAPLGSGAAGKADGSGGQRRGQPGQGGGAGGAGADDADDMRKLEAQAAALLQELDYARWAANVSSGAEPATSRNQSHSTSVMAAMADYDPGELMSDDDPEALEDYAAWAASVSDSSATTPGSKQPAAAGNALLAVGVGASKKAKKKKKR